MYVFKTSIFCCSSELFNANINYSVYVPPEAHMIFDYMVDLNTFTYHEWDTLVPKTEQLIKSESLQAVIPTVDIVRYSFLMAALLMHKKPVLLTGIQFYSIFLNFILDLCVQVIVVLEKLYWLNLCFDH